MSALTDNIRVPPFVHRRALVVEDEVAIRELLRLHLELAGFTLDEAGDGRRALDRARATSFDLILLDVMLPGLDGISVCRAIRARRRQRRDADPDGDRARRRSPTRCSASRAAPTTT